MNKSLQQMQQEVYEVSSSKGWYEEDRTVGDEIALLHSEVSEMLEAFRNWGLKDATAPPFAGRPSKPEGFGAEAADVLIRLLDTCRRRGVDLEDEYERKVAYNRTRPWRHGGKGL